VFDDTAARGAAEALATTEDKESFDEGVEVCAGEVGVREEVERVVGLR
jgi:hypothetical protein